MCLGINMSYYSFMCSSKEGLWKYMPRQPCEDTTHPVAVKTVKIPFDTALWRIYDNESEDYPDVCIR